MKGTLMAVRKMVFIALASVVLTSVIGAAQGIPAGPETIPLSEVKWVAQPNGLSSAMLLGDLNKPGPYLQLVKWPPNMKLPAHKHPDTRYGMVISGTHYVGQGDKFNEGKLNKHTVGTYFTEPANAPHFGRTKGEGAVLYFYGMGPSGTTPLE
jgi:hypothetical protein